MTGIDFRDFDLGHIRTALQKNKNKSSIGYINRAHCKRVAKKNVVWEELNKHLNKKKLIPSVSYSLYRQFQKTGLRTAHQNAIEQRYIDYHNHALGAWLDHPDADIDFLQDLIWAICDEHTWVMPAHEGHHIDLGSIGIMLSLAESIHLLGDTLHPEVTERAHDLILQRGLNLYEKSSYNDGWHTCGNNWNLVCNGGIIRLALLVLKDPLQQASIIHRAINNLTYALEAFTDDGGCDEGIGYWAYGFEGFALAALALAHKTGGSINLMDNVKIKRICEFPLAVHIHNDVYAPYSDSTKQYYLAHLPPLIINQFYKIPQLLTLCKRQKNGDLIMRSKKSSTHHSLALHKSQTVILAQDTGDSYLEDLRFAKCRSNPGPKQTTVVALAAHNDLNHNHNDTGNVCIFRNGQFYLDDPGIPIYTRDTFTDKRYQSIFCNAYGHNIPIINKQEQLAGKKYKGSMSVSHNQSKNNKIIRMELASAYPKKTVHRFQRTITLSQITHRVEWHDHFEFKNAPTELIENFVTFLPVLISKDKQSAHIGSGKHIMELEAKTRGHFKALICNTESKLGPTGKTITRILFQPADLNKTIDIHFIMN